MYPITVLKPANCDIIRFAPSKVQKIYSEFASKYSDGNVDFFVINSNASSFLPKNPTESVRFNYVLHPYIFYTVKGVTNDKAYSIF